jgi:hypothetical protein
MYSGLEQRREALLYLTPSLDRLSHPFLFENTYKGFCCFRIVPAKARAFLVSLRFDRLDDARTESTYHC